MKTSGALHGSALRLLSLVLLLLLLLFGLLLCSNAEEPAALRRHRQLQNGGLRDRGNDGQPRNAYPLGRCEGDCDGDSECEDDLVCYQRDRYSSVPSCSGSGDYDSDYCIKKEDHPDFRNDGSFRLKMYWEEDYFWQDEEQERAWCIECNGGTCNLGDTIHISPCSGRNTYFRWKYRKNSEVAVNVDGTNWCLTLVGDKEIKLRTCVESDKRQRFTAGNGGFNGYRFELIPVVVPGCLTQNHHPFDGEKVFRKPCDIARKHDTSFWEKY